MTTDKKVTRKEMASRIDALAKTFDPSCGLELLVRDAQWTKIRDETRPMLVLRGGDENQRVEIRLIPDEYDSRWKQFDGWGEVEYTVAGKPGTYSYERPGVEASFYWRKGDDLARIVAEQLARVEASRAKISRSVAVPGLPGGFSVTPERREEIKALLAAGKPYVFHPAGFGIGYELTTTRRMTGSVFTSPKVGQKQLAEFFGVERIYINELDCD